MKKTQLKGIFMLLLTAFIWGSSFVAQSVGMESVEAFTFNGVRTLMGAAVLVPFILIRDYVNRSRLPKKEKSVKKSDTKKLILSGSLLGVVLCVASNLQQYAFNYSTSGKIAFITAFYMLFVPVFSLFMGKKIHGVTWVCVLLGTVGLYFLCITGSGFTSVNKGDLLTLGCSVVYAVHILLIEKFAPEIDNIKLSCIQFFVSGLLSCILMFIFEHPSAAALKTVIVPLLYAGIMSCGLAYTFQIVGQKYTDSTVASLLMCMESVFGVVCSAILLHERMSGREYLGCALMLAAIIFSQVGDKIHIGKHKNEKNAA